MPAPADIDWKARAEEAERRAAEAWAAYHQLAAERADSGYYEQRLAGYEDSLSWKLTAPLRLGLRVLRWIAGLPKAALGRR